MLRIYPVAPNEALDLHFSTPTIFLSPIPKFTLEMKTKIIFMGKFYGIYFIILIKFYNFNDIYTSLGCSKNTVSWFYMLTEKAK
jgi:hypothetical protein